MSGARNAADRPEKVGFIVEGDSDRIVVETIARRILPREMRTHTVRIGGKAALPSIHSTVLLFREKNYLATIVVFDTDSLDPFEMDEQKHEVLQDLRRRGLDSHVQICPARPAIEAWLLAGLVDDPEGQAEPKMRLARELGRPRVLAEDYRRLAEELDLDEAIRTCPSLHAFVASLRAVSGEVPAATS